MILSRKLLILDFALMGVALLICVYMLYFGVRTANFDLIIVAIIIAAACAFASRIVHTIYLYTRGKERRNQTKSPTSISTTQ